MEPDKLMYPLSRYWYSDGYRFYYAYGNTPAQDFLQNCSGEKEPTVLVLGCGDIRSCFYSLWKNFDANSKPRFDGVHFVLNDISAAVLARNVLFLYLCLRMPEEESELKKWLSSMWAIWFCHELYPDHDKLLHDSLDTLCKYSEDWSSSDNPLHSMVKFTSPATLCEIHKVWKMWLEHDVNISSVGEMHASRQKDFMIHGRFFRTEADSSDFVLGSTEIPFETSDDYEKIQVQKSEVVAYCKTGNAYAEDVLELKLPSSKNVVNFTLFEREDGRYSLHYRSMPFSCYYQTVNFSSKQLRKLRRFNKSATPVQLMVKDKYFKSLPYLANSVQQFSLWLQSAHKVLKTFEHKQCISFTLDCSHAMTFCYELKGEKKPQKFDLIYTSNLMDHLGPPNLVLSALPLLKENGLLFTTTLVRDPLSVFSRYLTESFGFDSRLFPILLGVRCINYEGNSYASPVAVRPSPFTVRDMTCAHYEKVQVWEKVPSGTLPLVFDSGLPLTDTITEALLGCVKVSVYPLLRTPRMPQVVNHLCVETAVKVFQTFMSNCCADFSPQFWKPLSDAMQDTVKPYLHSIQTQLILHGIHMHLTVTEEDCPICLQVPASSSVSLFCVRVPIQVDFHTPKFFAAVHKEESDNAEYLCKIAREGGSVQLFDCVSTSADNSDIIELYFYAPLRLSVERYKVTFVLASTTLTNTNIVCNMPNASTEQLSTQLITHSIFKFSQSMLPSSHLFKLASFGTITSHVSNGDASEVIISLLERVITASRTTKLQSKKISSSEIQVLFGKFSRTIKLPYPFDFDETYIKFSRQERKIVMRCPRAPQEFQKEKPLFIINPDKQLSLLPHILSASALEGLSGQQFMKADRAIHKLCKADFSQAPPLVSLKNTLMYFFQQQDGYYYQFLLPDLSRANVHGVVLVNKRLYDYENRVPVVDLAFCFLEESFVHAVAPIWINISAGQSFNIQVSDAEYELVKEVFHYFAKRTDATCNKIFDAKSHLHLLAKHGVQKYFTRAVVSLLLYNPDIYGQFIRDVIPEDDKLIDDQTTQCLATKNQDTKCDNCGNFFKTTKFCSACRVATYCSQDCQQRHWKVHKHHCKKKPAKSALQMQSAEPVFPLARYMYYGDFKYYYAYGNTPAEDFLQSCSGAREPSVLSLGCGDIRSCFFTLWKNFDSSISNAPKQFNGVHFVLNDCSSPVLARNIVFILLCIQLPNNLKEQQKWLSAMWAVWYCHELHPQHQEILDDCLKSLLKYSKSLDVWVCAENPLCNLVNFTSPAVLAEISLVWKAWVKKKVTSVEEMHYSRRKEWKQIFECLESYAAQFACSSVVIISGDQPVSIRAKVNARIPEVKSYVNTGNCYAESVLDVDPLSSPTTVNPTLYERPDGVYTLHYSSLPFECYYHTVEFSPDTLKLAGVEKRLCDRMLVPSKSFKSHPLLANSVQQFSMWIRSASAVLNDENIAVSFMFNNQHALTFCQELQDSNRFSVIFSSNLMDHVGPANVVLSALPLLKSDALLFTATLLYKNFADTVEEFISKCFGFDCKLLPVILGARCINHEGVGYASPVMVQPIPVDLDHLTDKQQQQQRVLIWERVTAQPILISKLPLYVPGSVTEVLCDSIGEFAFSLLRSSPCNGIAVLNNNNIETAILVLLRLFSSAKSSDYRFWESLCTALREKLEPFCSGLQTQALLHGLHIHLTFTESNCPMCRHIPVSDHVGLFCAEVPLPIMFKSPCFMALIHNYSTSDSRYLCSEAQSGRGVHIIDCIDGTVDGKTLKLKFFAPLHFVTQHFKVTIASTYMSIGGRNIITTILPTASIQSMLIEFKDYRFSQTGTDLCETVSCSFGDLISHVYYQDSVQSDIAISNSALKVLASSNLSTKKISASEIQLSCGAFQFNLKFNFPIDYNHVNIKLSKTQKNVKIISPRQPQSFEEEKPFFIAFPDHQLSLPPQELDNYIFDNHFGMQMTPEEKKVMELRSTRDSMAPLTKVKETLLFFFKRKDEFHFHLTPYDGKGILGQVLVNKRVFDYQHNAPAVDLAFYFNDYPVSTVFDTWRGMIQGMRGVTNIFVDDVEYEELKKVVHYLASRTNGDLKSAGKKSRYYDLIKGGADKYFTRAVFYFLYCDPDQKAISVKENYKCSNCGKFCIDIIKCRSCKSAQYCSDNCRSRHWPKHSGACKLATKSEAVSEIPEDSPSKHQKTTCSFCKNSGILKKCLRCGKAQYCDRDCQTKHWPKHKTDCRRLAKEESSATAKISPLQPEASMRCVYCNISSVDLKLCTGCGKVKYCGTECQRKHWKVHKVTCN